MKSQNKHVQCHTYTTLIKYVHSVKLYHMIVANSHVKIGLQIVPLGCLLMGVQKQQKIQIIPLRSVRGRFNIINYKEMCKITEAAIQVECLLMSESIDCINIYNNKLIRLTGSPLSLHIMQALQSMHCHALASEVILCTSSGE